MDRLLEAAPRLVLIASIFAWAVLLALLLVVLVKMTREIGRLRDVLERILSALRNRHD